jgi:hypothetical protein
LHWKEHAREVFFKYSGAQGHFKKADWNRFLKHHDLEHSDLQTKYWQKHHGRDNKMFHRDFMRSLTAIAETHGFDDAEHVYKRIRHSHTQRATHVSIHKSHHNFKEHTFKNERKVVEAHRKKGRSSTEILALQQRKFTREITREEKIHYNDHMFQEERKVVEQAHEKNLTLREILNGDPLAKKKREVRVAEAAELLEGGMALEALKEMGFTAAELALYATDAELYEVGFGTDDIRQAHAARKTHVDLRVAEAARLCDEGAKARDLRKSGYSAVELWDAGYTWREVCAAGFSEEDLKQVEVGGCVVSHEDILGVMDTWFDSSTTAQDS